ncbi:phosphotransferase [Microbacterium sp. dk485]|uniref:phosphotransferase enzyme family protein n=1 Tax=Microbacterium sp. dk485 TaxID=2560021 RepID=UPI001430520D|nr:phosphotransferase [Microbacterium sp. dk485]
MELDVAHRLVRAALPLFGLDPRSAVDFVKYRENHVFRVTESAGSVFAVRLHRPGYRDDEEIRTEVSYLDALASAGVPVPAVRRTTEGALFSTATADGHVRSVSVQHWVQGARPFGDIDAALSGRHDPPAHAFSGIGAVLGRVHAEALRIGEPEGFRRGSWDADGLAGPRPLWGDPVALPSLTPGERAAVERGVGHVHRRLRALGTGRDIFGVIHADATPENLLETTDGFVLIDFDDFGTGWYVFDLVTAVFHHARNPRYPEFEDAVRGGYEAHRTLSDAEIGAWDDLMLARGLTYLGWAADRPGDPASEFISEVVAPWVADIAETLTSGAPAPWRPSHLRSPAQEIR